MTIKFSNPHLDSKRHLLFVSTLFTANLRMSLLWMAHIASHLFMESVRKGTLSVVLTKSVQLY